MLSSRTFGSRTHSHARSALSATQTHGRSHTCALFTPRSAPPQEATARIRKNFHYFKINYVLAMTAVLLVTMVLYPQSLATLSLVLAMWVYLYAIRTTPIVVNGTTVDGPTKMIACSSITMLVVFFLTVRAFNTRCSQSALEMYPHSTRASGHAARACVHSPPSHERTTSC